jgi:TolB-like protein
MRDVPNESTASARDPQLEIGHVVAMDIVGYSKLLIHEQSELLQRLNEIVRGTNQFRTADTQGKLIRLPTGDGMALVFFNDPKAPIECATEIATALKDNADIQLRMGIHSGPVNEVLDVNERTNVAGAGIDIAQRVMDCGDAGHILLSKRVADDLAPYARWNAHLHDLGECEVKHGRKISLVNFYTDEIANPQPPLKCRQQREEAAIHQSRLTSPLVVGATLLVLVGLGLVIFRLVGTDRRAVRAQAPVQNGRPSGPSLPAKSIAVLPFENLSRDPDNAYFADGIQEEILTRLSKIADLKVISRTSTQRYKSAPENLSEIAKQLGVAHVLEGSVQKATDQVRVNVQLIKADNDSHLWADTYDRKLIDIFGVESEIATKIADTLQAKLTGAEQHAIAARPTQDSDAHELYLKGRYFAAKRRDANLITAIDYFNQAVAKDPNYAPAYAGLADSYALLPEYSNKSAAECFPKARAAANKALMIDDSLAEAHTSLALVLADDDLKFKEAQKEFERAIELNPNYAAAHYFLAITVLTPLAQFDRAIEQLHRALELDPFSVITNANLGYCYLLGRRYPEAIVQLRKTVELDENFPYAHGILGQALEATGDFPQAIAEYEKSYEVSHHNYHPLVALAHISGLKGEREKALQLFNQVKELQRGGAGWAYGDALIYLSLGDKSKAIDCLEQSYRAKESGIIIYIKVDPMLDPLRGDPRFEKLANQIVPPESR